MKISAMIPIVFVLFICHFPGFTQEKYSRVKVFDAREKVQSIAALGVTIEGNISFEKNHIILEISKKEIKLLKSKGYKCKVLIRDMSRYYRRRNKKF